MKRIFFILLATLIAHNTQSMERLAPLQMPEAQNHLLISFEQLPNPQEPASLTPLRLWQPEHARAELELPLVNIAIASLEKKHDKAKKALNAEREKIIDYALYAAGSVAICVLLNKIAKNNGCHLSILNTPSDVLFNGITSHSKKVISFGDKVSNDFVEYGFIVSSLFAAKNILQSIYKIWKIPALFNSPQEPAELIKAREKRDQLLLTLQQARPV